jgi:hypothetical protein
MVCGRCEFRIMRAAARTRHPPVPPPITRAGSNVPYLCTCASSGSQQEGGPPRRAPMAVLCRRDLCLAGDKEDFGGKRREACRSGHFRRTGVPRRGTANFCSQTKGQQANRAFTRRFAAMNSAPDLPSVVSATRLESSGRGSLMPGKPATHPAPRIATAMAGLTVRRPGSEAGPNKCSRRALSTSVICAAMPHAASAACSRSTFEPR